MRDCVFSGSIKDESDLFEVVDMANRPLCLLHGHNILRQNLPHRAVAALYRENGGKFFLRRTESGAFGFSAAGMLPAGMAAEDFFHVLASRQGMERGILPSLLSLMPPGGASRAFTWIFSGFVAGPNHLPADLLPLDRAEIRALMEAGYAFEPFFRQFLEQTGILPA